MPTLLILILGGVVLRANGEWFNGAETVGTVMLALGIAITALWVLALLFAAMFTTR